MNVYQTDINGVFVGTTTADQDPMDNTNHLIPAGCVLESPPTLTEGQLAQWVDESWVVTTPVVEPEPVPEPVDLAIEARNKRNGLLTATDWSGNSDVNMSAEMTAYRAALRDVPQQAGFPNTIIWPTKEATP
jgi:hypothetical protein